MKEDEVLDADTLRRRSEMRERVKRDLGRRGIGGGDITALEREMDFEGGAVVVVLGWTLTVRLRWGKALVYRMDNLDGAQLVCNGTPVPEPTVH